jgi:CHAT domain-containing protein
LKNINGQSHPDYFMALNHYAEFCVATQDYQKADSIYRNTLYNIKQKLGDENGDYLSALKGLAGIYTTNGNYKEAKKIISQALLISKKLYTENNYRYAQVLLSLGKIYADENNNFVADSIFSKVLEVYAVAFGENHPAYGIVLGNLADLYISNGEFSKAEDNFKRELVIYSQSKQRRLYSMTLSSLGHLLMLKKQYKDAEEKLLEAKSNQVEIFGDTSLDYAFTLVFLAELYDKMGKYEDAIRVAKEASQIRLKILGDKNIMYAGTLNLLSVANFHTSKYDSAAYTVKKAIKIYESSQGSDNEGLVDMLLNLSKYYVYDKKYDSAVNLLNKSNFLLKNHFSSQFFTITSSEQQKFLFTITPEIESICSLFYLMYNNITSATRLVYDNELLYKGIILRNSEELSRLIKKNGDQYLIKEFDGLRHLKVQIQQFKLNRNRTNSIDLTKLESIAESKEKLIIQSLSKYNQRVESGFNINWLDVQKKLRNNDAAIEFIHFKYRNQFESDSIIYGALVLRPAYKEPKFVYLFEQKQIESIIQKESKTSDSSFLNQLYQYGGNGKKLQELVWKPIDSLLEGVETVYAAPSGILHTINISALPLNNYIRLGDRYNLRLVGSTGEIVSLKEQYISDSTVNKAWLFGGIDYNNISFTQPKFSADNEFNYSLSSNSNTRSGTEKWIFLLNTLYEASSIDTLCRNNNITTTFVNGKLASKTVFKNISGEAKPYILHLATHGYFFPDIKTEPADFSFTPLNGKQNILKLSDNPLLRSGLIFSGANKTWSNPNYQSDSTDDGILTALEVSNLDLSEAKLVVMSACETGLGDIKGSEGVFGLQRAFKLAGAKNIIMSLWKVPDAQTKELMKLFYQNCFNGLSISEALRTAQSEMSKKYSPYYWAAFKLLE